MYGGGFDAGGMGGGFDTGGQFGDTFGGGNSFGGDAFAGSQFAAPPSQGGGFAANDAAADKGKSKTSQQSLIPVTIKQLKNAPPQPGNESGFQIDGKDLHQVTFVGLITNAEESNTNLTFTIEDGSDNIPVKMWRDNNADEHMMEKMSHWKEGVYVRVIGQLRAFNQSRSVVAFHIAPLQDFNEYTFHFIEVVHTHLAHTRGPPPSTSVTATGGAPAAPAAPMMAGAPQPQQNGSLQDLVLSFFQQYGESEQGCTITECNQAISSTMPNLNQQSLRETVDYLLSEGHLYSTIDDDHFKATS